MDARDAFFLHKPGSQEQAVHRIVTLSFALRDHLVGNFVELDHYRSGIGSAGLTGFDPNRIGIGKHISQQRNQG